MKNQQQKTTKRKNTLKDNTKAQSSVKKILLTIIYVLAWLVIWVPAAMVLGATILLTLAAAIASESQVDGGEMILTTSQGLTVFVIAVLALAVIFFVTVFATKRFNKFYFAKIGRRVLLVCTIFGLIVSVFIFNGQYNISQQADQKAAAESSFKPNQNKKILKIAKNVGAKYINNLSMGYVDGYSDERIGEYQEFRYTDNNEFSHGEMTVKKGLNPQDEAITVAHEYLHHIWAHKLDDAEKRLLTSQLITMYGRDGGFQSRFEFYSHNSSLSADELFAIYCSESVDYYLTEYVLAQCNKYINRNALELYR